MGLETALLVAAVASSVASAGAQVASSRAASKRAKKASAQVDKQQALLDAQTKNNETQAAGLIKKNKGIGSGKNKARDTILTGPNLGGTQTGKTLLGA